VPEVATAALVWELGEVGLMKSLASRAAMGLMLGVIAFFGLKSCIVTVWTSPKEATSYSVVGTDGRTLSLIFLPKRETVFVYSPDRGRSIEANLSEMKGTYGTHYFWRLWSVEGPGQMGGLLGYRLYPDGFRPVMMESTVKRKFMHGSHKPVLPEQGARTHPVILFSDDAIEFEGMVLEKHPTDSKLLADVLLKLRQ
jgi:hypothetical protein